ncbi:MAG: NAD(P)H-dependent oxidoreductase subunit E [Gammaproteobacteria bacterium]|nr:NAD(P)H-dependent oxidoreductase subunit E [Gammaproteobacteria bacterium]MDH5652519.1 NAD(P)H-dependent oxidoreductase subunit E [Gammaproteobacteria bacterium]
MSYYKYHLFFCTNQRDAGEACCANHNARAMRDFAKQRSKQLGLAGEGGVRVNLAGCLGRCTEGPVIVIYPEETWYTYVDEEDIEEIMTEHLRHGRIVERLLIPGQTK